MLSDKVLNTLFRTLGTVHCTDSYIVELNNSVQVMKQVSICCTYLTI